MGFSLDQRHSGASVVGPFYLTCFASLIFPVVRVHLVLLGRIVEELNGRQIGGVLQMPLFLEEAIPAHRESVAFDSFVAVLLAASVLPCEQIQQVFQVAPLVDARFLCLLASGVSLHLPTEWSLAGHSAVGEFHETPEQAVMLFPSSWQPLFVVGGHHLVGLSSLVSAFPSLAIAE